jgi:YD repeat-containing protein
MSRFVQVNISNGGCGGGYASLECPMFTIVGISHSYYAPMNASGQISLPVGEYKLVMDLSFVDPFGPYYSISYGEVFFQVPPQPSVYGTFELKAGGLRIKSIQNWDFSGNLVSQKKYDYNEPETGISSGRISQLPEYRSDLKYLRDGQASWGTNVLYECNYIGVSSSTNYPLANTKGGAVGYKYVKEVYDQSGEGGMTEYYFTSPESNPDILQAGFPFPPVKDNDWQRGHLLKEVKWKAGGTVPHLTYEKVSEKQLTYTPLYVSFSGSIKHGQRIFNQRSSSVYDPPGTWFELTGYSSTSGIYVPVEEKHLEYSSNGSVYEESKTTTYNPINYLPVSILSTNSKGHVITTEMKYPYHYAGQAFADVLNNENKVNEVVEQKTINQSSQLSKVVKEFSVFSGSEGSYTEISKIKSADKFGSLNDDLIVTQRDANRNVIEAKGKDGVVVALLYGYNRSLPVAKIVGVPYSTIQSVISESAIQSLDGNDLRLNLSPLRNISGAQVTIYTYKKGVGLSSETDTRGRTTYYDYDSIGRLLQVRDHEDNILKRFCYNFAGDPVNCN